MSFKSNKTEKKKRWWYPFKWMPGHIMPRQTIPKRSLTCLHSFLALNGKVDLDCLVFCCCCYSCSYLTKVMWENTWENCSKEKKVKETLPLLWKWRLFWTRCTSFFLLLLVNARVLVPVCAYGTVFFSCSDLMIACLLFSFERALPKALILLFSYTFFLFFFSFLSVVPFQYFRNRQECEGKEEQKCRKSRKKF